MQVTAIETMGSIDRRTLLGGGVLLLALAGGKLRAAVPAVEVAKLNAWIAITPDNRLRVAVPAAEMGQGATNALPRILVDELGGDWALTDVFLTPGDAAFINPKTGDQSTGRSMSVRGYYPLLRKLGAQARERLIAAAAARTGKPVAALSIGAGNVVTGGGRPIRFAELVADAAKLPDPKAPALRPRAEWQLVGKRAVSKDAAAKTSGRATFAGDIQMPGLLIATVAMSPVFGGKVKSYDRDKVLAMPGVRAIVPFGGSVLDQLNPYEAGIAVVADTFWQAKMGRDALDIVWEEGRSVGASSAAFAAERRALSDKPAVKAVSRGDVAAAAKSSSSMLDVWYDVPFLAHATMEPMSCVAHVEADKTTLWAPTQGPLGVKRVLSKVLGQPVEAITVNRTYLGGGFGRRWQRDFAIQVAEISQAVKAPVKLLWMREEDMQHDFYRPAMGMRGRASFGADGKPTGIRITTVGPSIANFQRAQALPARADTSAVAGIEDTPYDFAPLTVEWVDQPTPFPIGVWRGVGHSQNGFFMESLIDEIAVKAGEDPYRFRRKLLAKHPAMVAVLDKAASAIGWGTPVAKGHGRGIAFMESYGSYTAHAAEVHVADGVLVIDKLVAVIDPSIVIDPYNIVAQMQGGAIFALSAMYHGEITMTDGKVDQSLYSDYPILTLAETPPVEVYFLESERDELGGVGECGVPTVAPAVLNALAAATGQRIRSLPLAKATL